jgi:hypothetical protein
VICGNEFRLSTEVSGGALEELSIPVQTVPRYRFKLCHGSGLNGSTIPVQTVPQFICKLCHGSSAKYATIPVQNGATFLILEFGNIDHMVDISEHVDPPLG